MEGRRLHWHTPDDIQRLRQFVWDFHAGTYGRSVQFRAAEAIMQELEERLRHVQPYGCPFYGVRMWLPEIWISRILKS